MNASYPPDIAALINSIDEALCRLRREMKRAKELLKVTEEYRGKQDAHGFGSRPRPDPLPAAVIGS